MMMSERRVRGYVLRERIGSGGVGEVYRAYQDFVGRDVAIKVIGAQYANDPHFIHRFQVEAQTIARLEHPHIVPLYDYWRDAEGAYLVMRWVQGGNIRHALNREGGWELSRALSVVAQVGAAVAFSHRRNVIHRDLKPENILLDIEGNAYVTDFGIAIDLQEKKLFDENISYGSPYYAAPEQFSDRVVAPQADVYSLGILIFEMLTGRSPFEANDTLEVLRQQFYVPLPSVRQYRSDVPEELDRILRRATEKDWQLRYAGVMEMLQDLRELTAEGDYDMPLPQPSLGLSTKQLAIAYETRKLTSDITSTNTVLLSVEMQNPYKGLQVFTEADAGSFFGRDEDVETLLQWLDMPAQRFVAVTGASGIGKSSLVQAGLFPALRRGHYIQASEQWFIAEMSPGRDPIQALEEALLRVAVRAGDNLDALLWQDAEGVIQAAQHVLPGEAVLLLYVDQFEEIFTLVDDLAVREHFLKLLHTAATSDAMTIYVVITLRADFYDAPLAYPDFARLMREATYVVLPLNEVQLREVVVNPAQRVGVQFEPNLDKVIVADVQQQANALPLLQYTLSEMFDLRDEENYIMHTTYQAVGGVTGALARRADLLYETMPIVHQRVARQLLLRLVVLNEDMELTRRRMIVHDVLSAFDEQNARLIMDAFVDHRLLAYDRDPRTRQPTVEIAHEALLTSWEPLRACIEDSTEGLRVRQRLGMALADWLFSGEDESFLATGARLSMFKQLLESEWVCLTAHERHYLQASIELQQQQRRRRLLVGMVVVASVAVAVLAIAMYLYQQVLV